MAKRLWVMGKRSRRQEVKKLRRWEDARVIGNG
jgi:hypothetical protein